VQVPSQTQQAHHDCRRLLVGVCLQAGAGLNDALLRASAERAAQAILMTPLVSHDYDDEDHRLASKVMTGAKEGAFSMNI
jgi:hypothetical protein